MSRTELQGICKRFGGVTALHEVDCTIQQGEFFTLLGPSGSGKTTLLRILAGLEQSSGGRLLFDGEDVTRLPPWKRQIAMVFQNYALYPHMTVGENIGYPLMIKKTPEAERRVRIQEVSDALQIGHLLDRKPTEISGGQQQRVALARALAHKPRLFLFDEPLSNLDAKMRLEARTFLRSLQQQLGITAVYVTHDQTEAMAMSDRMAILEKGHLRQVGTPREVYRRPADPFVASFVGSPPMNLLNVVLEGNRLVLGDAHLPAPPSEVKEGRALLGIRPEALTFSEEGSNGAVPARVILSEDFGHEVLITLEVSGQRLTLRATGEPLPAGRTGFVRFDVERAVLYPVPA